MEDNTRVAVIDAQTYFASIGMWLKWYNYEELKKVTDLRRTTTAVGSLPNRLAELVVEDAEDMGLAA